jgi:hypothetical protein
MRSFMKKSALLLALLLLSGSLISSQAQSGRVRPRPNSQPAPATKTAESTKITFNIIPKDTIIDLHLDRSLSSKTSQKGEEFVINVSKPVLVNDQLLLGSSARVKCHIISVQPAARKGRNGTLTIGFDELILDSGEKIKLHATLVSVVDRSDEDVIDENGEGKIKNPAKGKNVPVTIGTSAGVGGTIGAIGGGAAGAGIGAGVGAGIGLGSVLLAKGQDVELLAGSRLQVKLDADLNLAPAQ